MADNDKISRGRGAGGSADSLFPFQILCGSLQNIEFFETFFPTQNFMRLTGIQANGFTASEFYRACIERRLRSKDISFALNGTTPLKLKILPQLMQLHKCSKMVGESLVTGNVLYTEKVVGNVVASMGFVLDRNHKKSYYVPNTILNKDIRELSSTTPKHILAVLKKESSENTYNSLVFAGKKYETFKQQIDSFDFSVASRPSGC